jgi:peptidoglycan/xylan/chitin deacetylase (PgdA/CDA1 family)
MNPFMGWRDAWPLLLLLTSCQTPPASKKIDAQADSAVSVAHASADTVIYRPAAAAVVLARPQIPVLCYHQIRDFRPTDSKRSKDYIVPVDSFQRQMRLLADSGYQSILPDQLYAYLNQGASLPRKPVMLTFDDTDLNQYTIALPELKKYGFKAVFFIMTVSLDKPRYMSRADVRQLSAMGEVVGSHTWDHHNVKKYQGKDWEIQIDRPTRELEQITGKPIRYFAYPFGLWNRNAITELKKRGFVAAFQLNEKRDPQDPLYTIRRIILPGTGNMKSFEYVLHHGF